MLENSMENLLNNLSGACSMNLQSQCCYVVVHVDKVRLCLCTVATNGPTVHPPGDICVCVWRAMVE
jgi:hypothetical protein